MNTMETVGTGLALSPQGETPGLNLGADAETLALFASLFAMMQTPQQDGAEAGPASPVPKPQPQAQESKPLLPAAAMLMAELAPTTQTADRDLPLADMIAGDPKTGEGEPGDAAGLLKLLVAAQEIAAPDRLDDVSTSGQEPGATPAAPARTATEMLTGAIEILKSLEAAPAPSSPVEKTPDQMLTPPPSADFIGPMPVLTPSTTLPEPAMALQADPEFIGPMPTVTLSPTQSASAVVMLADPDFVGLMPEASSSPTPPTPPTPAMLLKADPDFIGPMPVVTPPKTLTERAVLLPAAPDFVGPMPAVTPAGQEAAVPVMVVAAPSLDFIGPMPAVTPAGATQPEGEPGANLNDAGQMSAITKAAATAQADQRIAPSVLDTAEPMPAMAVAGAAPDTTTLTETSPEAAGPLPGNGVPAATPAHASGPTHGPAPASAHGPKHGPAHVPTYAPKHSPAHGPYSDLHAEPEQVVKSSLPRAADSENAAGKDDGFVPRRANMVTADREKGEKMADHQKAAEIQSNGARMVSRATEVSQGSAASTSASVQAVAQQAAAAQAGKAISAASTSDVAQNVVAGTTGGQSGGQSGGRPGTQQSAQQMVDAGQARGAADRTLLHRLNTDNAGWSELMVKRLTADLRSGVQSVRIILEPRQLGRLNVELGLRNDQASIRIAAETQEAAKLLSGARSQLGQMLESAGMRLASFQATGSQADTGLDTGQGSQGRGGEGAGDNAGRNNAGRNKEFSNKIATALDDQAEDATNGDDALREGETAVLSILA